MTTPSVLDPFRPSAPCANGTRPPAQIRAEEKEITPAMARAMMARHKEAVEANSAAAGPGARDNRPVRWDDVGAYARDMQAGKWDRNGESIKIAWDETVVDGQHRLFACMQADTSFWTVVVTGVDPQAQDTIDTGIRRKLSDQLAISHEENAVVLATLTRWALRWERGARNGTHRSAGEFNPTNAEILEFLAATPRLRDAAAFAVQARKTFKPVRPSAYGMAWLLFDAIDPDARQAFLGRILDGTDLPGGHPVLAFRARMMNAAAIQERLNESEQLALLIVAWNAFREERKVMRLQLPKGGLTPKNFPEPK